jgi:hypothetical protein
MTTRKTMKYTVTSGTYAAGIPVGIVMMETHVPYPPGSPNNAQTFDFPVSYAVVPGASMETLIYAPRFEELKESFLEAGRTLVDRGVRAVVGGCGFMVLFQEELANALPVPVYSSSLIQLPMIASTLNRDQSVGIITASGASLTPRHLEIACRGMEVPHAIGGLEHRPAFKAAVHDQTGELDFTAVEAEVAAEARELQEKIPNLGAILLECTDLPPYAHAVRQATGLPVYDVNTLIDWAHHAVVPRHYGH